MPPPNAALLLQNRHTGEELELRRVVRGDQIWVALRGTLPPHRQGPPLHAHYQEVEEVRVEAGTLSAVVDGRQLQLGAGETAIFPAGSIHRWWNDGDGPLILSGWVKPAVDFDRYAQAMFDVLNSGTSERPPLFFVAHVAWRHRRTQGSFLIPRPIQAVMLPLIVTVGTILGRYRGTTWPGSSARCLELPLVTEANV
jgi:mannose-6-phosphate isomerase-like protein (cupin superfamily)